MSDDYFKKILKHELSWCKFMGYFNPYVDPFQDFLSMEKNNTGPLLEFVLL